MGPNTEKQKQIFKYLYLHFTHNIFRRIFKNISFLITSSFSKSPIISATIFIFVVAAILKRRKNKFVQIITFNIFFFFVLYVIIRYDGLINAPYRYNIFIVYHSALILPFLKISYLKNKNIKKKLGVFVIVLLLIMIIYTISQMKVNPYYPFNKNILKNIFKKHLNKSCNYIYIGWKNKFIIYTVPKNSKIINVHKSLMEIKTEISNFIEKEKCTYVILPSTSNASRFYFHAVVAESWCKTKEECKKKMSGLVNYLNKIGKRIYSYNIDKEDLGGIYIIENK